MNYFFVVLTVYLFVSSLNLFSFNTEVLCDRAFESVLVGPAVLCDRAFQSVLVGPARRVLLDLRLSIAFLSLQIRDRGSSL